MAGSAPAGWLFHRIDSSAALATVVLDIPTVVDFPEDQHPCALIRRGDRVRVDGESGMVEVYRAGPAGPG